MGFRTVVILFNDQASEWEKDPSLGKKIAQAMNHANSKERPHDADLGYGRVVECAHADTQTLGVLNSYNFMPLTYSHWFPNQSNEDMQLALLKQAADKLGYRLTKKPQR